MSKLLSISHTTGDKTAEIYQFLHRNFYEKNWKDAPVLQGLVCTFVISWGGTFAYLIHISQGVIA